MESRKLAWFAAMALSGALLVGCGDNGQSSDTDNDTPGEETMDREPGTSVEDE